MRTEDLHSLLEELVALPAETEWVEFKLGAGSITNDQIGEYISGDEKRQYYSSKRKVLGFSVDKYIDEFFVLM